MVNIGKRGMAMFDVASVGILVADVLTKPVDKVPEKGLLQLVDSIELFTGGNAMTASINLQKLGLSAAVVGKVGKDYFGRFLQSALEENGVCIDSLSVDERVITSSSVALSSSDGERSFLHCLGANAAFNLSDVNWTVIEKSKIIFVTGSFLLESFDGEETVAFLKKCKEMGKVTALDVCWDSSGRWMGKLGEAMPYIDYFLPSVDEARELSGKAKLEEMSKFFFEMGVSKVIIKLGADGCFIQESKDSVPEYVKAFSDIEVVDTTGAGDSFCSGFLAALSKGKSFSECARFANAMGALCVMNKGATSGTKTYDEVERFMRDKENEL